MKITRNVQQPVSPQQVEKSAEKTEAGGVKKKAAAQRSPKGDTVELSNALDAELRTRESRQAQRVETLKSLVKSGKYKVDSREVAEKMLADKGGS